MIVYVLTSDGGSREDGNAFYAGHVLVDVEDDRALEVQAAIEDILAHPATRRSQYAEPAERHYVLEVGAFDYPDPVTGQWRDDPVTLLAGNAEQLAAELVKRGWPATAPSRTGYIVRT